MRYASKTVYIFERFMNANLFFLILFDYIWLSDNLVSFKMLLPTIIVIPFEIFCCIIQINLCVIYEKY